jgi:peptidyl-prolyl cis-trans isomerase D
MSVMESIRRSTDSTAMKLVFGAIIIVFVFWGIGGQSQLQLVAEVNGARITDTELTRLIRNVTRGETVDDDRRRELEKAAIDALIARELMLQEAKRAGLEVSDDEVALQVVKNPAFLDDEGEFSRRLYEAELQRQGLTRSRYEERERENLLVGKLQSIAASGLSISDAEVKASFAAQTTRLSVRWALIPDGALVDDVPVDAAAIAQLLSTDEPRVKERYEAEQATRWSKPRRAALSLILLRTDLTDAAAVPVDELRARLEAVAAEARGGADFGELARRWSEDASAVNGGDQGRMAEGQLDPALAAAVFAAGAGQITGVVETARGLAIAQVREVLDAEATPYEQARDEIARELIAKEGVGPVADAWAARVLADWQAGGAPPAALLAEQSILVTDAGPFPPSAPRLVGAGPSPELESALRDVRAPGLLPKVYPTATGRVIVEVTDYAGADDAFFEQVKGAVRMQLLQARQQAFLDAWEADLRGRAKVVQHYQP